MHKIELPRKSYYMLGLVAVACSLAGAIAAFVGSPMTLLDNTGFVFTGMAFLLLAAIPDSPGDQKRRYFVCFFIQMLSIIYVTDIFNYLLAGLYWPLLARAELLRGQAVAQQARLVVGAEVLCFALRLAAGPGGQTALYTMANGMYVLAVIARGWLLLALLRLEKPSGGSDAK